MKKLVSALLIIALVLVVLPKSETGNKQLDDAIMSIQLIQPSLAESYGVPIDTSNVGLMLYYYDSSGFTLVDTVAAWVNYTDHSTYYDGFIRVDFETNGTTFSDADGDTATIDLYARLRADGYLAIWLDRDNDDLKYLVHWGRDFDVGTNYFGVYSTGNPPILANVTCHYRALQRIYYAKDGSLTNCPSQDTVKYYDWEHSAATRLAWYGKGQKTATSGTAFSNWVTVYYTIPSGVTVDFAAAQLIYGYETIVGQTWMDIEIQVDSTYLVDLTGSCAVTLAYGALSASHYTLDTEHYARTRGRGNPSAFNAIVTVMIWTH